VNIAKFAVKHPVTITIFLVIMILFGVVSWGMLSVDLLPDMELPMLIVMTEYPDAGPEEVEDSVTKIIEQNMASISGIDTIQSQSTAGMSVVLISFEFGTDLGEATNSVRDALSMAEFSLPEKCGNSSILKMNIDSMPIMTLTVASDSGRSMDELVSIVNDTVVSRLERIDGVAAATVNGGVEDQVHVILDNNKLATYGLNTASVGQMIAGENAKDSAGYIAMGERDILLNIDGEFQSLGQLGNMSIALQTGEVIKLSDIAEIKIAKPDNSTYVYLNGEQVLSISIQKESGGNTVNVDKEVREVLAELDEELYDDIIFGIPYTSAKEITETIDFMQSSLLLSAFIAMLIILMFLGNIRSTIIIGIAIPVVLLITFNLLYFGGYTLNMITLGAMALSVGMVVDNSTVVLENIYRHQSMGKGRYRAAVDGTQEVMGAVVASTLTTVAVYVPMVFISGLAAEILVPFAVTICFTLFASLAIAIFVVPMMSSKLLTLDSKVQKHGIRGKMSETGIRYMRWFNKYFDRMLRAYGKLLNKALDHKVFSLILVSVTLLCSFLLVPFIGSELIPSMDSGQVTINIELPNNTKLEETWEITKEVEALLLEIPECESLLVTVGSSGGMSLGGSSGNTATMTMLIGDKTERKRSDKDIAAEINEMTKMVPGVQIVASAVDIAAMVSSSDISVSLKGQNLDDLEEYSERLASAMSEVDGLVNIRSSMEDANTELSVIIDKDKAAFYSVSSSTITSYVQLALNGLNVSSYKGGSEEIDIIVKLPDDMIQNLDDIRMLMIPTNMGALVPLEEIAEINMTTGQKTVVRVDQSRVATVSGTVYGRDLGSVSNDVKKVVQSVPAPKGCSVEFGGSDAEMMEVFEDLFKIIALAVIMVYGVMACQFESWLLPLIIMVSLPVMFIGVFLGLFISGNTVNMMSLLGILLLEGVVVNNAIVLVDYIQTLRRDGMCKREAILQSGTTRMRPILITTLTTMLAMLPQFLGNGTGSEMFKPMSASIIFGLAFSTMISLFVVPIIYELTERFLRHKKKNGEEDDAELMEYTLALPDECNCWHNEAERAEKLGEMYE